MSDVRNVLSALCKFIKSLINVDLTVEHLSLAGCGSPDEAVTEKLWNTLHILSYHAAREKRSDIDFRDYDTLTAAKLHLAYLRYPATRFYGLSRDSNRSRDSLIALAWLFVTHDALTIVLRTRLINSALGAECSHVTTSPEANVSSAPARTRKRPSSTGAQLNGILHLNARVNLNLREIAELTREKGSLISKVHAASIGVSGLPHLCVSELALTKRIVTAKNIKDGGGTDDDDDDDRRRLREYRDVGVLLDMHAQWRAKRHAFLEWMITVIQEHEKSTRSDPRAIDSRELATFGSLLRDVVRDRSGVFMASGESVGSKYRNSTLDCSSRAYRSRCNNAEMGNWSDELNELQNGEQESLQRSEELLASELKEMLQLIPSSIRV